MSVNFRAIARFRSDEVDSGTDLPRQIGGRDGDIEFPRSRWHPEEFEA